MNNHKHNNDNPNLVLLCAMCRKQITTYTVTPEEMLKAADRHNFKGFICDDCYMLNVEPEGNVQ